MLVTLDFKVTQGRYVKAITDTYGSYRPDGLTPEEIATMITNATTKRLAYINTKNDLDAARALRRTSIETLHGDCLAFAVQARSRFRKNPTVLECLDRLPVQDQTFQETLTRADAMLPCWRGLPEVAYPAGGTGVLLVHEGDVDIDPDVFEARRDTTRAADVAIPTKDQAFQKAEADVHVTTADLEDFVTAALAQGFSQYAEGSAERELVAAVPTTPPQHAPAKGEVSAAEQTGPGAAHLEFNAEGATSWDVFDLAPGATEPVLIADDIITREFDASDLAVGVHQITVRGRNARGTGAVSDPVELTIS